MKSNEIWKFRNNVIWLIIVINHDFRDQIGPSRDQKLKFPNFVLLKTALFNWFQRFH